MNDDRPTPRSGRWAEIRWRQFRNAPATGRARRCREPVGRGRRSHRVPVYDIALSRGAALPGGDLRLLALVAYTVLVLVIGSLVTYLVVPQPTGSGTVRRRSAWSAALGFFAAVPIAWLVMVVALQVVRPWLG